MKRTRWVFTAFILLCGLARLQASSVLLLHPTELMQQSDAICRGTVVGSSCFKDADGSIHTRTSLRVDEAFKGKFPAIVLLVHRGGRVGNDDEFAGESPRFFQGQEYLVFLKRSAEGQLFCTQGSASAIPLIREPAGAAGKAEFKSPGQEWIRELRARSAHEIISGADVTDQAGSVTIEAAVTTGMLDGVNARFLQPDRGESIPVLIDADSLPSGISLAQATNAVQQALNAWSAVTSLHFTIESVGGFGHGADTITTADEKIRIQLHDLYNSINTANVLGIGGRGAVSAPIPSTGWNLGGNVAGNEFLKTTYGYVVLEATNAAMQNLSTLTEVLCHEVGHALNMAHSSENPSEPSVLLKQAMMYFQAHADGRGATLGAYDPPIIRQAYPSNTPPFTFSRVMDIVTASTAPNVAGINEIELRGYDLQGDALTAVLTDINQANGTFALVGNKLKFTPSAAFSDSGRADPADGSGYDNLMMRVSDGTNASPYAEVTIVSFSLDSFPAGNSDGIPNTWMTQYFGNANPAVGVKHGASQDFDGDGLSNFDEYRAGMNPLASNSVQKITAFDGSSLQCQTVAYEVYDVLGSTNLITWTRVLTFQPTNASVAIRTSLPQTNIIGSVSNLSVSNPQMFYRVLKVP